MENEIPNLDAQTLEYVHKLLMRDWEAYNHLREVTVSDRVRTRADAKVHAVGKLESEIMSLIWMIRDAQEENENGE